MSKLQIRTPEAFAPLLEPARYKGAYGGRGSGKSHFFAELLVEDHLRNKGMSTVCIREVQKSLAQSSKRVIESKIEKFGLERHGFKAWRDVIETPGDGLVIFQGMQDHTAESIKSLEGYGRSWVEEAQTLSQRSLELLRPTIRAAGSELWFSWNPRRPTDPVDAMLRGPNVPTGSTVVRANWNDNPWFPKELEQERLDCLRDNPEGYPHIWEGEYARVFEGAYFATHLEKAEQEGRIGEVGEDPLVQKRAYWDIGGTSNKSDATAIWVVQFIGSEVRVLDYYETIGQPFSEHVHWLRKCGHDRAVCKLPHDGRKHDTVHRVTPQGYLADAGLDVETLPNIGVGAATKRIEAARRVFPSCRFNREKTQAGRDALAWYHEKRDDARGVGLGPEHDWASHGADAFGQMCVDFLERPDDRAWQKPLRRNLKGVA